jgi:hypothetical protein
MGCSVGAGTCRYNSKETRHHEYRHVSNCENREANPSDPFCPSLRDSNDRSCSDYNMARPEMQMASRTRLPSTLTVLPNIRLPKLDPFLDMSYNVYTKVSLMQSKRQWLLRSQPMTEPTDCLQWSRKCPPGGYTIT